MRLRLSLGTLWAALACLPTLAAAGSSSPSTGNSLEALSAVNDVIAANPELSSKEEIAKPVKDLMAKAQAVSPEEQPQIIRDAIRTINEGAQGAAVEVSPEAAAKLQNGMSSLNNSVGSWAAGRNFARQALGNQPLNSKALLNLSAADSNLKRWDEAQQAADQALRADPQNAAAWGARALAAYGAGRFDEALASSQKALSLNPDDRLAYSLLKLSENRVSLPATAAADDVASAVASEYEKLARQVSAAATAGRTARREGASQSFDDEAARAFLLKNYPSANAAARMAVTKNPEDAEGYYYLAASDNLLGHYKEAVDAAGRAIALDPRNRLARDARAWANGRLGNYRDAVADSRKSLAQNPMDGYALADLGYAYGKMGDPASMLRHLKLASRFSPRFAKAYRDAARSYGVRAEAADDVGLDEEPAGSSSPSSSNQRSFPIVLISSLIGGVLIALGLVNLLLPASTPKTLKAKPALRDPSPLSRKSSSSIDASYTLGRVIGSGGMGVVYEAFDRALDRRVAIKVMREDLRRDPKAKGRFLAEARTVANLHHPGIVDIHAIIEDDSGLYLVFEHIEGRTLAEVLRQKKRLALVEAKALVKPVCQALDYAHSHGVVHRDLKPSNIMITDQGVKVMDFGISRNAQDALRATMTAQTSAGFGTPLYMAPEQEEGIVRPEADIYSLGACLYELVTGERPFREPADAAMKRERAYAKPSRLWGAIPSELDAFIDRALEPDPEKRIHSAREFWKLLEPIKAHDPAPVTAPKPA